MRHLRELLNRKHHVQRFVGTAARRFASKITNRTDDRAALSGWIA
jgi:hypothetical protein